jgi:hypothetical protein
VGVAKGLSVKVGVGVLVGESVGVPVSVGIGVSVLTAVKVGVAVQAGEGIGLFDWAHKTGAARRTNNSTQYVNLNALAPKMDRLFVSVVA